MLIQDAELGGCRPVDVRCGEGCLLQIAPALEPQPGEAVLNARGGALLRGLHDHHMHLFALAASQTSILCGPPRVRDYEQLCEALRQHPGGDLWLRGYGYHESVAGHIDRWLLDKMIADIPLRVQHRSGKMWVLNSCALERLALDQYRDVPGLECDASGKPTGRLFRLDDWLRGKIGSDGFPDLSGVSRQLASFGVTGVSDATPGNSGATVEQLSRVLDSGQLLQRVFLMGELQLPCPRHPLLQRGPVKIMLDENQLPELDSLKRHMEQAHEGQRPVAIHCVTPTELVYALSVLGEAGSYPGDRIEHASIAPDEVLPLMRRVGVTVVTQPGFILQRGDQYLQDVEPQYQPALYRGRGFLEAGIPLAGSSDAPYGDPDPWLAIRSATTRLTATGRTIGEREKLSPEQALALFSSSPQTPGTPAGTPAIGDQADLCLLSTNWVRARERLSSVDVAATIRAGEIIYRKK